LAAARIKPGQLERLRAIVKRMRAAARDAEAYFRLNIEFHEALAEAGGNQALAVHYRRVVNELNLYRREAIQRNLEVIPASTKEHEAIVDAIAKGEASVAARLLYEHVIGSRTRLLQKSRKAA
ncbi:MAG TPA: FCD domain-containing protein, partial [Steroidobacteraceae bacterium]|nr:FCD domain-containing protein [Steroidobacteraceae bacterium]